MFILRTQFLKSRQDAFSTLRDSLASLQSTSPVEMMLTGGYIDTYTFAPEWVETVFVAKRLIPTHPAHTNLPAIEELKTIAVDNKQSIWDKIAAATDLGELAPPGTFPMVAHVYFDSANKPMALRVHGALAIVVPAKQPR